MTTTTGRNVFVLVLSLLVSACGYDNDGGDGVSVPTDACGQVREATIDADVLLETDPGLGAGAFIEYAAGGRWRIFTSCDTLSSGFSCLWDVIVSPLAGNALFAAAAEELEPGDSLTWDADSVRLIAHTDVGFDGFSVEAEPGGAVRVDALLDGECANRYMFWNGDGGRHEGSPSNPLDLVPNTP